MKTLTSAAWDFAQKREGVEPLVVVQLFFATAGYRWYGGAEYSLAGLTVEPRLKSVSPIRQRLKEDGSGSVSECRVELFDDDEAYTRISAFLPPRSVQNLSTFTIHVKFAEPLEYYHVGATQQ